MDYLIATKNAFSGEREAFRPSSPRGRSVSGSSGSAAKTSASPSKASKRKSTSLPPETVEYLKAWMMSPEHIAHPYPTEQEKAKIMEDTGIELKQLTNWFVNNRKRFWKPHVEARLRLQKQAKAVPGTPNIKPNLSTVSLVSLSSLSGGSSPNLRGLTDKSLDSSKAPRTPLGSPQRTVSEQSSLASDHGSVSSAQDQDDFVSAGQTTEEVDNGMITRTESVDVHILRPVSGGTPTIEDVSILFNVPEERILRSYENCALSFTYPASTSNGRKKMASRRDVEIVRMKKHYLKLFLAENDILPSTPKRARPQDENVEEVTTPRPKYRRVSIELWKSACLTTSNSYDEALPSLEEATQLFGYASN